MRIYGTSSSESLPGTADNDIFYASAGNDFIDGRGGNDTASYAGWSGPVTVMLGMNGGNGGATKNVFQWIMGKRYTWYNSSDTLRDIENVIGSQFDDTITGNEQDNILAGLGGRDTLNGDGGVDTVDYSASDTGVTANLSTGVGFFGHAEGDRYQSIENVIGSTYRDTLMGNAGVNTLRGMGDRDYLNGLEGGDTLDGGEGIDTASTDMPKATSCSGSNGSPAPRATTRSPAMGLTIGSMAGTAPTPSTAAKAAIPS